jgi:Tannase and feruloyl esterase
MPASANRLRSHRLLVAALLACSSITAQAQPFANADSARSAYATARITPGSDCAALGALKLPEVVAISAKAMPADATLPAHCRVSGTLDPEIAFEVNLPATWNGRFYMIGNGGLAGERPDDARRAGERQVALAHGFVIASTNTGHDSQTEPSGTFVLSNPQKATDYAFRAVHLTAVTAKAIVGRYYGQAASRSYWNSCSNGGRQGLIEAERYPEDFDGIIANAAWVDQTGFTLGAIWNQQALTETPVSADKIALVADRVMAKCDAVDGLKDGLIDDPRECSFSVAKDVPACPAGSDSAMCLTPAQAAAVQMVYDGPSSNGRQLFPGYMIGSEQAGGWNNLILPSAPDAKPADFSLAEGILRYLVFDPPRPDFDFHDFDFDSRQDIELLDRWSRLADATDIDLEAFRSRGGKLIMTYGWADPILQPLAGVDYYERAVTANGDDGTDFLRLFMVPGMSHCAGGIGPDQVDSVTAVIDWVERNRAPESLVAKKIVNGETTRSRPLCPYPQVARYKGKGSIDDAGSFECRAP